MYGVRGGRRRPFLAAFPSIAGRSSGNGGGTAAESGQREPQSGRVSTGAVPQPSIEVTARVTAVIDPCSFWAQVGEGRRLLQRLLTCACVHAPPQLLRCPKALQQSWLRNVRITVCVTVHDMRQAWL